MADYTTPFFGDRDMGEYSPPALDYASYLKNRNRQEATQYNETGQVYSADVLTIYSAHQGFTERYIDRPNYFPGTMTKFMSATQFTVDGESNHPLCIFAMPSTYGNIQRCGVEGYEWLQGCVNEFNTIPNFFYFLLTKSAGASITIKFDNNVSNGNGRRRVVSQEGIRVVSQQNIEELAIVEPFSEANVQSLIGRTPQAIIGSQITNTRDGLIKRLQKLNDSNNTTSTRFASAFQDVYTVNPADVNSLSAKMTEWAAREDSVLNDIYYVSLYDYTVNDIFGGDINYRTAPIGSFVASGFPVFTLESFDEMIKYFQGEVWIADNDTLPPSDWSTDWDIYIKGAQRPDIFITMNSEKVNEWLTDLNENKSGTIKENIEVQYRYRVAGSIGDNDIDSGKYFEWVTDKYNETRATSYSENIQLNYQGDMEFFGEFSDWTIKDLMRIYASMEFRLSYGKYKSTWCRYHIGVIGSPSVPDFEKMDNYGEQHDDWQDSSTVTLHYDEYPDGWNPYPTPPQPDMPDLPPTYPSPSETGIGLLTTTYKITKDNAQALGRFFWGGSLFEKIKALNTSPIENVVGLVMMPIDITGSTDVIVIGNVDTNINGDKIESVPLYEVGSVEIKGRYSYYDMNFLDFEPYTTAHLFLPFVGFIRINPQVFTNKTLKVIYSYDIINGLCNAMLFADDVYIESHQGNCGIEIPLIASNRTALNIGLASSLIKTTATEAMRGDVLGTALSLGNAASNYVTGFQSSRQGGYSPTCAWTETRQCFLVLETPNAGLGTTFKHDYGRPCMATYSISQLSGFTVCDQTIDLSGISGATEEEKTMIKEILTNGFYA